MVFHRYLAGNDVCAQWNDETSCHAINRGSDPANDCGWSIMEKNHCTGVRWKMQTEKHEGFYVTYVVLGTHCCCIVLVGAKDEDVVTG